MPIDLEALAAQLLPTKDLDRWIRLAIEEDLGKGDLTSENAVDGELRARARLVAKESGVLACSRLFELTFRFCDPTCNLRWSRMDGDVLEPGDQVVEVEGNARALLLAERTALNFLQRMCGVATATAELVALAQGRVRVLDTRKTTPGLRAAQKYSVCCGGGENHRFGLFDQVMIKENHIEMSGLNCEAVTAKVRAAVGPEILMTVEARDGEEAFQAVRGGADVVMLDNMAPAVITELVPQLRELAEERGRAVQFEASGGIDAKTLSTYADCGIDRISVGALTHSAPALDLSLYVEPIR
jgi:nicotinate-nucleotide pyrophosphorylase (carboxylating)